MVIFSPANDAVLREILPPRFSKFGAGCREGGRLVHASYDAMAVLFRNSISSPRGSLPFQGSSTLRLSADKSTASNIHS